MPLTANGTMSHGLTGFTAVNGDGQHHTSFRPDDSVAGARSLPSRSSPSSRSWTRPDQIEDRAQSEAAAKKRKRAESNEDRKSVLTGRTDHPEGSVTDRPIDLTSPQGNDSSVALSKESNPEARSQHELEHQSEARERSPIQKWNSEGPVPPPRPEDLDETDHDQARTTTYSGSPLHESHESRDQSQGDIDESGDRPRKRVFSNRTKTGCHTCRSRKKKCDEGRPDCQNCIRGAFTCMGYGAKPPNAKVTSSRGSVPLQSKPQPYEPSHGPTSYYGNRGSPPRNAQHQWREQQPPPEIQQPRYNYTDSRNPHWPPPEAPHSYNIERLPPPPRPLPPEYPPMPPIDQFGRHPPPPPPPSGWSHLPSVPGYAPPAHPVYRYGGASDGYIKSRGSVSTNSSGQRTMLPTSYLSAPLDDRTQRGKMILGQPYHHYSDHELVNDRQNCQRALQEYNEASKAKSGASDDEKTRCFKSILDPTMRTWMDKSFTWRDLPIGGCGSGTIVQTPFQCEFGYNIHLGDDTLISSHCRMQDCSDIIIGDRCIIGDNVRFVGMTAGVAAESRRGCQGAFMAGPITVEDDCFIGADVIILPFRTIGKGAVVGAGSVVTKDVKAGTVVAGNPAKFVRTIQAGPNVEKRNDPGIQEQNEEMLKRLVDRHRLSARGWGRGDPR